MDCARPFTFTAGEQSFFAEKGFTNKPNRCPDCRAARKAQRSAAGVSYSRPQREMFRVTCSGCGGVAEVPFQPRTDKPVYCRDCFQSRGGGYHNNRSLRY
jgi:CxxC-x17-CxxC domain-containing protein